MKFLAFILTAMILSACDHGGGSGGGNGDGGRRPGPGPGPGKLPAWGELSCQRSSSCANPVLNVPRLQLENLLHGEFSEGLAGGGSAESREWSCGKKTVTVWNDRFPSHALTDAAEQDLQEFFFQMLDVSTCTTRPDIVTSLTTYFKNTKEYKNEVSQQIISPRAGRADTGGSEGRAG